MATIRRGLPVLERLALKSHSDGDCIVYDGERDKWGYGRIRISGRQWKASRAAWVARHGEIPSETPFVLHRCDNPPCWRDEHLFLGTQLDNMRDKVAKGRLRNGREYQTHCKRGHALSEDNVYLYPTRTGVRRQCRACAIAKAADQRARGL